MQVAKMAESLREGLDRFKTITSSVSKLPKAEPLLKVLYRELLVAELASLDGTSTVTRTTTSRKASPSRKMQRRQPSVKFVEPSDDDIQEVATDLLTRVYRGIKTQPVVEAMCQSASKWAYTDRTFSCIISTNKLEKIFDDNDTTFPWFCTGINWIRRIKFTATPLTGTANTMLEFRVG